MTYEIKPSAAIPAKQDLLTSGSVCGVALKLPEAVLVTISALVGLALWPFLRAT